MANAYNLKEFQESLARRLRQASGGPAPDSRLAVQSGGHRWLIRLDEVGEVLPLAQLQGRLAAVPLTQPWYLGLANVRGRLVSLADLSQFAGGPASDTGGTARVVLMADRFDFHGALLVERLVGLRSRNRFTEGDQSPGAHGWEGAVLQDRDGTQWRELDIAALVKDETFLKAGA